MLGISVGTSTTICAFVSDYGSRNERVQIVGEIENSCVAFNKNKDEILVGNIAEKMGKLSNKWQTIYDFNRLIGQKYSQQRAEEWQKWVPNIPIKRIFNRIAFEIIHNGETKLQNAEQILAQILNKMRIRAEKLLQSTLLKTYQPILFIENIKFEKAILTVPACIKMSQRHAIEEAAGLAGFSEVRLLTESLAAGYGFAYENPRFCGHLLVFNWGAGYLDISILDVFESNKNDKDCVERIEMVGMRGDANLGGRDIDAKIVDYFEQQIVQQFADFDLKDPKFAQNLRMKCKKLKEDIFSFDVDFRLEMDEFDDEEEFSMTPLKLLQICHPFCEKAMEILLQLLADLTIKPAKIAKFLLTGGTSRIPLVKRLLIENGFDEHKICVNFDLAIAAKGAAIFGAKLAAETFQSDELTKNLSFCEQSIPHGLDIFLPNQHEFLQIFPPNTTFPTASSAAVPFSCQTMEDGQSCMRLELYERGEFLASATLDGLPNNSKAGSVKVDFEVSLGLNGLPRVECTQISYPTNSASFRVCQRNRRELELEFGHFHGWRLPSIQTTGNMTTIQQEEEKIDKNPIRECPICFAEIGPKAICCEPIENEAIIITSERHFICDQCIIQNATVSAWKMLAEAGLGLPCMATDCANILTLAKMRRIIPEDVLHQFDDRALEQSVENIKTLESCTNCNFRIQITNSIAEMRIFNCPECYFAFCRKCKFPWDKKSHFGRSCEQLLEAERERIRLEEEEKRKRLEEEKEEKRKREARILLNETLLCKCVRCGIQFVKDGGCNRVVCARCITSYCWICKAVGVDYSHFCNHLPSGQKIPLNFHCQSCNKHCSLYGDAEAIEQKMENIRKSKNLTIILALQ